MPKVQRSVRIARPVSDVFAFFADPANEMTWRGDSVKEFTPQGPIAVGTRIRQVVGGPMGRSMDADIEITALDPGSRYAFKGVSGPVRPTGEYTFRPVEEGTEVTFRLDAPLSGLKKVFMGNAVEKAMTAEMACLDTARTVLEAQAPA
jgi:uncharacterized protein YndB with AHSA1/START domain